MSLEPIVEFFDRETDVDLTEDGWDVGVVRADEESDVLELRVWNNRGGQVVDLNDNIDEVDEEEGSITLDETQTATVQATYDYQETEAVENEILDLLEDGAEAEGTSDAVGDLGTVTITGGRHENYNMTVDFTDGADEEDEEVDYDAEDDVLTVELHEETEYDAAAIETLIHETEEEDLTDELPDEVSLDGFNVESEEEADVEGSNWADISITLEGGEEPEYDESYQLFGFAEDDIVPDSESLYQDGELIPSGEIVEINEDEGYVVLDLEDEAEEGDISANYDYFTGETATSEEEELIDSGDNQTFLCDNAYIIEDSIDIWKGGRASYMQDVTLFVLDSNDAQLEPIVTEGWVVGKCVSLDQENFERLDDEAELEIGSEDFLEDGLNQIGGEENDGEEEDTENFADIDLKVDVPYNATHGEKDFSIAVRYYYT